MVAARELDRPLTMRMFHSCPVVAVEIARTDREERWNTACSEVVQETLSWLTNATPGLVVLSSASNYWTEPSIATVAAGNRTFDTEEKLREYERGLRETVVRLQSAGHQVLVVKTIPTFVWAPQTCPMLSIVLHSCVASSPYLELPASQLEVYSAVDRAMASTNAEVLDLADRLCPHGLCATGNRSLQMYRDGRHVTVGGSAALAPQFLAAIRSASSE